MSAQDSPKQESRIVVSLGGASGSAYGVEFLKQAVRIWDKVHLTFTSQALAVAEHELGITGFDPEKDLGLGEYASRVHLMNPKDLAAPPSSGSYRYDGMVVVPCSMGTLGRIAHGISNDLTTRIADVCLKEKRKLVLVTRETPLSLIHLHNMLTIAEAGAVVLPASPGLYHKPQSVQDMIDFIVARMLQSIGVDQQVLAGWKEPSEQEDLG
ncbi:MAG: UbiX family flavin prenyltransferase [Armatimonadota bacterium]